MCGTSFAIPEAADAPKASGSFPDDTIVGWLTGEDLAQAEANAEGEGTAAERSLPVLLTHADTKGALFQFDPELLYQEEMRGSLPRRCAVCESPRDLWVQLIVWSPGIEGQSLGEGSLGSTPFSLDPQRFGGLSRRELLAKLPRVEGMPEPYCLPFPYYICVHCPSAEALTAKVCLAPDGSEECELGIPSLLQAELFAAMVCGPHSSQREEIRQIRKSARNDAWEALPKSVRMRIRRWYRPEHGEKFLAFVADAAYSEDRAGRAGVVLTDQRVVYRKNQALLGIALKDITTVRSRHKGSQVALEVSSWNGTAIQLMAAQSDADHLKHFLREKAESR